MIREMDSRCLAEKLLRDWNAGLLTRDQMLDRLVRLWWMGLRP